MIMRASLFTSTWDAVFLKCPFPSANFFKIFNSKKIEQNIGHSQHDHARFVFFNNHDELCECKISPCNDWPSKTARVDYASLHHLMSFPTTF